MAERTDHDPNGAAWAPDSGLKNTTQWISPLPTPDSPPNPLPPVQSGFSRRRLLGATAAALGVAVVGGVSYAAGKFGISPRSEIDPYVPERTYQSGDTIKTAAGNVRVSGWRFDIDPEQYTQFLFANPEVDFFSYDIHLPRDPSLNQASLIQERGVLVSEAGFNNSTVGGRPYKSTRIFPFGDGIAFPDQKPDVRQHNTAQMALQARQENGRMKHSNVYSVELKYHTAPGAEKKQVYFEEELTDELRAEIESFARDFDRFSGALPRIYVYNALGEGDRAGYKYTELGKRVVLPSAVFTDPEFKQEGYIQLCQALAHEMIREKTNFVSDDPFVPAYERAVRQYRVQGTAFQNIFNLNYHKGLPPHILHTAIDPFRSQEALFVSALTTLKMYPERFFEEYSDLGSEDKDAVREVVFGVERTLNEAKSPHNSAKVVDLIPKIDQIDATIYR